MPSATTAPATSTAAASTAAPSRNASATPPPHATDDEILGIISPRKNAPRDAAQLEFDFDAAPVAQAILPASPAGGPVPPAASSTIAPSTSAGADSSADASANANPEPAHLRATFDANPELRAAWRDANSYRESFATPEAAREATALVADLNHMDALFFSRRPEDHTALARAVANLDPAAFSSLAQAMNRESANVAHLFRGEDFRSSSSHAAPQNQNRRPEASGTNTAAVNDANAQSQTSSVGARHAVPAAADSTNHNAAPADVAQVFRPEGFGTSEQNLASKEASYIGDTSAANHAAAQSAAAHDAQLAFLNAANAAAVEGVVAAIESQVERLLPAGVAKNARTRVVGEIYRELDSSLRSNPQFAAQLRDAFRSGPLDYGHHRAIVSLLTGRARQALPGVAKRVLNEWTSTIVSAAHERRTRQRTAEKRVDIAGSGGAGNDGRRSMSPRDLDYARLTDADILNL
jgi:hypothetical protein